MFHGSNCPCCSSPAAQQPSSLAGSANRSWGSSAAPGVRQFGTQGHSSYNSAKWQQLAKEGVTINPCKSKHHPAVKEGIAPDGEEMFVQEAYNPESTCWGCGPAHPEGLQLKSKRAENGLTAIVTIPKKYCAFPGIVNGGILSTIVDCHGNWTAAISLMDRHVLPRPPLTVTASVLVTYKEPTPPDTELLVVSKVREVKESTTSVQSVKTSVEVEVFIYEAQPDPLAGLAEMATSGTKSASEAAEALQAPGRELPHGKLLVKGTGIFVQIGALRSL